MLDARTRAIIKASAPVLAERGLEVMLRMYELLFSNNPEIKHLFNQANQKPGGQPLALARAVHAFADNIDHLDVLVPTLELVANKHAALGVKPEHYGIVGVNLLQALKEVLDLDDEYIEAWKTGYFFLADLFIGMEKKLYNAAATQEGGWEDYRTFILERKVAESDVITSFYLKPKDGRALATFKPGQYVTVKFNFPGGNVVTRNYSLSDLPGKDYYRISIKREAAPASQHRTPQGLVSTYLHDYYEPGMEVDLRAPMGNFVLNPQTIRPIVLLSGGVGITPTISMLKTIAQEHAGLQTYFIHGAIGSHTHAMREDIHKLTQKHNNIHVFTCYSDPSEEDIKEHRCHKTGFITAEWLEHILPQKDCDFYFCGPKPFMQLMYQVLKEWNIPASQIHYEFFGPAGELEEPHEKKGA